MDWLMVGSSPSVLDTLPNVHRQVPKKTVITCNSGIKLVPTPDYYFAVDEISTKGNYYRALAAQEQGTILGTLHRSSCKARKDRHIEHYDLHIREGHGEPTREQYGAFRYTGPLCVEFACRNGAKVVHLVGFDGYRHATDYFDPKTDRKLESRRALSMADSTHEYIQPRLQRLAAVFHDVWFVQYGTPCFQISTPNWIVSSGIAV